MNSLNVLDEYMGASLTDRGKFDSTDLVKALKELGGKFDERVRQKILEVRDKAFQLEEEAYSGRKTKEEKQYYG